MISPCGGIHDSLALDHRSQAGTEERDQRVGNLGFGLVWAFFCAPCVVVSLSTSLWEGFLMALVEMGLVMCGRKLSLCVTLGGSPVEEWQLCADTKPGHFQTAQERIRILGVSSCCSQGCGCQGCSQSVQLSPAMGAVLGLLLLFTEHWLQELQCWSRGCFVAPAITDLAVCERFCLCLV